MRTITTEDIARIMVLTAEASPAEAYAAVDGLAKRLYGHCLFTVTRILREELEVERVYSSHPAIYPVGGRKQKRGTHFAEVLIFKSDIIVSRGDAEIEKMFQDHALIRSLGVRTSLNVPIRFAGQTIGLMNMSHAEDAFGEADYPTFDLLAGLMLPLLLAEGR